MVSGIPKEIVLIPESAVADYERVPEKNEVGKCARRGCKCRVSVRSAHSSLAVHSPGHAASGTIGCDKQLFLSVSLSVLRRQVANSRGFGMGALAVEDLFAPRVDRVQRAPKGPECRIRGLDHVFARLAVLLLEPPAPGSAVALVGLLMQTTPPDELTHESIPTQLRRTRTKRLREILPEGKGLGAQMQFRARRASTDGCAGAVGDTHHVESASRKNTGVEALGSRSSGSGLVQNRRCPADFGDTKN